MIDRELPTRAHQARREPQIAAANGLLGRPGCRRLASSGEPTDDRPFRSRHLGNPGLKHLVACVLDRRSLLAAMLIGAGLASIDQASADVAPALKVVLGFAPGSFSARAFSLLKGGLARELGGPVEEIYMVGDQGRRAAATVAAVAGPDEPVVLVIADFTSVVLPIVYADVPERPDLRPIAKLSRGISLALVVSSVSEWRSWSVP